MPSRLKERPPVIIKPVGEAVNMKLSYNLTKSGLYVYFDGELDDYCGEAVKKQLDEIIERFSKVKTIIFNMRDLSFMDSTGIGILIGRYKKLKKRGVSVYIESPSFAADKVFQTGGIYTLIPRL